MPDRYRFFHGGPFGLWVIVPTASVASGRGRRDRRFKFYGLWDMLDSGLQVGRPESQNACARRVETTINGLVFYDACPALTATRQPAVSGSIGTKRSRLASRSSASSRPAVMPLCNGQTMLGCSFAASR